jgi:2-keto-4-pentenoate hydratase
VRLFGQLVTFFLSLSCAAAVAQPIEHFAKELLTARDNRAPIPNISHHIPLEMSDAYKVQNAYIQGRLVNAKLSGFKAGLTSSETQAHFSVARPIFGALFDDGDISDSPVIAMKNYRKMMIETELGFITKRPIRKTVDSVDELKSYIGQVIPVVEFPEINFAQHPVSGIDLVAANCAANVYITDKSVNWLGRNINNVSVTLSRSGKIVNQGQGKDALGDQWEALRWLVNQVLFQGWNIESGFLLITGVLGEMIPAEVGNYKAQFNEGTQMKFSLVS